MPNDVSRQRQQSGQNAAALQTSSSSVVVPSNSVHVSRDDLRHSSQQNLRTAQPLAPTNQNAIKRATDLTAQFDYDGVEPCQLHACPLCAHKRDIPVEEKEACDICARDDVPSTAMLQCKQCSHKWCCVCILRAVSVRAYRDLPDARMTPPPCAYCRTPLASVNVAYLALIYEGHHRQIPFPLYANPTRNQVSSLFPRPWYSGNYPSAPPPEPNPLQMFVTFHSIDGDDNRPAITDGSAQQQQRARPPLRRTQSDQDRPRRRRIRRRTRSPTPMPNRRLRLASSANDNRLSQTPRVVDQQTQTSAHHFLHPQREVDTRTASTSNDTETSAHHMQTMSQQELVPITDEEVEEPTTPNEQQQRGSVENVPEQPAEQQTEGDGVNDIVRQLMRIVFLMRLSRMLAQASQEAEVDNTSMSTQMGSATVSEEEDDNNEQSNQSLSILTLATSASALASNRDQVTQQDEEEDAGYGSDEQ